MYAGIAEFVPTHRQRGRPSKTDLMRSIAGRESAATLPRTLTPSQFGGILDVVAVEHCRVRPWSLTMNRRTEKVTNYGNWVSTRIILAPLILAVAFGALVFLTLFLLIPAGLFLLVAAYFAHARYLFSPRGANVQEKVRSLVSSALEWDGNGKALDIGCGSAALTIGIAQKFPSSKVIGTDFWGGNWEYSQKACQDNATLEKVGERVAFQKGSASALPFSDGEFDAVVSNLVFHEVKDATDKLSLVKEALRVLKKGGSFALQDLFYIQRYYGKPEEMIATIKGWGVERIELVETRRSPFIPPALKLPFMVGTLGLMVGEK